MPFNPDAYLAAKSAPQSGSFNPDAYLATKDGSVKSVGDNLKEFDPEAALQGFGNELTAGYLPQLQAVAEKITPKSEANYARAFGAATVQSENDKLRAQGFNIQEPKEPSYLEARDVAIARQEELQKRSPVSSALGTVAGIIPEAVITGGALGAAGKAVSGGSKVIESAKPLGLLAKTAQAGAGGAALGVVQNPGDVAGQINPLQAEERGINATVGLALGGALHVGTSGLKAAADLIAKIPGASRYFANLKALKSAGMTPKDFEKIEKTGSVDKIGQAMINGGLVKAGSTFEDVVNKSSELKETAGKMIGSIYKDIQAEIEDPTKLNRITGDKVSQVLKTKMNPAQFADEMQGKFSQELKGQADSTKASTAVKNILDELRANGSDPSILKVQEFKVGLDRLIKYNQDLLSAPLAKQYLKKVRDVLKDKIEAHIEALDSALGKNRIDPLKKANSDYGVWSTVNGAAAHKVSKESMNRFASLTDTIVAAGGIGGGAATGYNQGGVEGAIKGAAMGAGLGAANKVARLYGNPILVKGANTLGGAIGTVPMAPVRAASQGLGLLTNNPLVTGVGGSAAARKRP